MEQLQKPHITLLVSEQGLEEAFTLHVLKYFLIFPLRMRYQRALLGSKIYR